MALEFGNENKTPTTAQFSFRIAVIGGMAVLAFAVIFFRLWYLQVLSSDRYAAAAANNQIREIRVQAPRGEILDRDGRVLVGNRSALTLQVNISDLPGFRPERHRVLHRVSDITGIPYERMIKKIGVQRRLGIGAPVALLRDVPDDLVFYLRENADEFSGVSVDKVFVRRYPEGSMAAHAIGYVGEVSRDELGQPGFKGLSAGDIVGKAGLEAEYDQLMRGAPGVTRIQVDVRGRPIRSGAATGHGSNLPSNIESRLPVAGNNLVTTLDRKIQRAGEQGLADTGLPGAFVAMQVDDGAVLGLGSAPTYNPEIFIPPAKQAQVDKVFDEDLKDPASADRAVTAAYPAGSTFKLITALAALRGGLITADEVVYDRGFMSLCNDPACTTKTDFTNSGDPDGDGPLVPPPNGSMTMTRALQISSDVYFYLLGFEADGGNNIIGDSGSTPTSTAAPSAAVPTASSAPSADPEVIQNTAFELGLGAETGIDLPEETAGLVPTPEWRNALYRIARSPDSPAGTTASFADGETDRPWSVGDNINLAVGQGDLQTDPLQMAVAYAALANGGDIVRPHLASAVEDPTGRVLQNIEPEARGHIAIDPTDRAVILEGLREAAMTQDGTSFETFGGYPIQVAGKTGTAEVFADHGLDQAWYIALAPADDPEIVVAVTVERGGFGADTAAPIAKQIFDVALDVNPTQVAPAGVSTAEAE